MTTEKIANRSAEAIALEERWIAWVARGLEHDRQSRKHAVVGLVVLVALVALGLIFVR